MQRPADDEADKAKDEAQPVRESNNNQVEILSSGLDDVLATTNFKGIPQFICVPDGTIPEGCASVTFETIQVYYI